ncbi:fumarylacetoacetate (FAA) hydrolase [Rhodococcus triatomae BKS 15-14]|nr:fumarylacetoacetate (FAA) hydrolase [Rhodococcus triatomae BKS 15-14]
MDLAVASQGRFSADIQQVYEQWDALHRWWNNQDPSQLDGAVSFSSEELGPPVPRPRQVFCLGANYAAHAAEAKVDAPESPVIFTKFPSSLTGPASDITLVSNRVDWEAEVVVVVGRTARAVSRADAWSYVAGVTVGQDISERRLQFQGPLPQLSIAKSLPGFGPIGPVVVSVDELEDPDDLVLGCLVNGEEMQRSSTSDLIFDVPELVEYLSTMCTLYPGDLIFTGTPEGVGATRRPPRFLAAGDVLETWVEGVGRLRNTLVPNDVPVAVAPAHTDGAHS